MALFTQDCVDRLLIGVPVVPKRFSDIAKLCISEMDKQLESGVDKKVYRDCVIVLEK